MRRDWNKIISLLCAAVFLLGLCRDYAVSSLSGITAPSPMPAQSTGQNSVFKMPGVKISASKNYLSDSFVINIQDYHGDYASQLAICGILEKIAASGKKTEIYVEGAYREVDLSYLKEIKSAPAFEAFVQMLLKNGKLTGAEFFALKNPGVRLNGLEDLDLYMRNLKNLSRLIDGRENILSGFEVYSDKIAGKILASLNPENKKLYSIKQKYEKDKTIEKKYTRPSSLVQSTEVISVSGIFTLLMVISAILPPVSSLIFSIVDTGSVAFPEKTTSQKPSFWRRSVDFGLCVIPMTLPVTPTRFFAS